MKYLALILVALLSLPLVACSMTTSDNPTREAPAVTTEVPNNNPTLIRASFTPVPSDTAVPPTSTPVPTSALPATTVPTAVPPVIIRTFETDVASLDAGSLAVRNGEVPVTWDVRNRPANSNLYFEQILPDGRALNVELPRDFVEIPSWGTGWVSPVLPRGDSLTIQLRLRVADMTTNTNLAAVLLDIPVENHPNGADYTISNRDECLDSPYARPSGLQAGGRGIVAQHLLGGVSLTISDGIGESFVGELKKGEQFAVLDGPFCFYRTNNRGLSYRQWRVRSESTGAEGWAFEYDSARLGNGYMLLPLGPLTPDAPIDPAEDAPEITSFTVSPARVNRGDPVTLAWEIDGVFDEAKITWLESVYYAPVQLAVVSTSSGSFTLNAPEDDWRLVIPYYLEIVDTDTKITISQATTELEVICPYSYYVSDPERQSGKCPISEAVVGEGVYQAFEHGFMIWDGSKKEIFVLTDSGNVRVFPDTWAGGDVVFPEDPPSGRIQPVRGFGTVWVENESVRDMLGWAMSVEGPFTLTRQQVDDRSQRYPGSVGTIYMTIQNGRNIYILVSRMGGPYSWSYLD